MEATNLLDDSITWRWVFLFVQQEHANRAHGCWAVYKITNSSPHSQQGMISTLPHDDEARKKGKQSAGGNGEVAHYTRLLVLFE